MAISVGLVDMTNRMHDQAHGLRCLMGKGPERLVAVVGSSPGVGATSVARNLAAALMQQGKDALVLEESGHGQRVHERQAGRVVLMDAALNEQGALSPLALKADHVLIVLQPSAESITAAYVCIKTLHRAHALRHLRVLVNFSSDVAHAQRIILNLATTTRRYLAIELESAGSVVADPQLAKAQRLNSTAVEASRISPAAVQLRSIAAELLRWPMPAPALPVALPMPGTQRHDLRLDAAAHFTPQFR